MTVLARQIAPASVTEAAVITGAEIAAGHDGAAELALSIRYENGVTGQVVLDAETGFSVMQACGVHDLASLIGRPWRDVSKGL